MGAERQHVSGKVREIRQRRCVRRGFERVRWEWHRTPVQERSNMLEVVSRQMPKRSVQVQKRRKSTCWQHLHSRALRYVVSKGPSDVSIVRGHRGGAWEPVVDLPVVLSVEKWSVSTMRQLSDCLRWCPRAPRRARRRCGTDPAQGEVGTGNPGHRL